MDPEPTDDLIELTRTLEAQGIDLGTIEMRGSTIVAKASDIAAEDIELPPLLSSLSPGGPPQYELGDTLGEGGMGLVRAARQHALQREVAIKTVRPGPTRPRHERQLLREARVTGLLEHPNVPPVHAVGRDAEGRPLIVMKRIEGTEWTELLAEQAPDTRMSAESLRRHLGILQQVAAAVGFAHSRGILHRDIKPDNVMIGPFGEVYVMDWGIAVRTTDDPLAGVPHANDVRSIEGTPGYLAPEMVAGEGPKLSARSDIYLLGATLHHVMTGEPPHLAPSLQEIVLRAFRSAPPEYDATIPRELAAIATRAMARDSIERFESAAAFVAALDEFLVRRGSLEICEEAERRAAVLRELMESTEPDEGVDALFHEARFGFEQALRGWPDNERAATGRHALIEAMIAYELERGGARAAQGLLRQHDAPRTTLVNDVGEAVESVEAAGERLASLEHDIDLGFAVRLRVRLAILSAASWLTGLVACGVLSRNGVLLIDHNRVALVGCVLFAGTLAAMYLARKKLLANEVNRRIVATTTLVYATGIGIWLGMGLLGLTMAQTTVVNALLCASLWATLVLALGRAWLPMALGHIVVGWLAWIWPIYHFEIFGLLAIPILATAALMLRDAAKAAPPPST